jgi:DNA-binding CsgD family transcriptional regulator
MPIPAWVHSRAGAVVWQNAASLELAGNRVDPAGLDTPSSGGSHLPEPVEEVLRGRREHATIAARFFDASGRPVAADATLAPLRSDGEIVGVVGLLRRPASLREEVGLTARQHEVLVLLGEGLSTDEIAGRLAVATETVRNHVRAVLRELGVTTRVAAVAEGYRRGLLQPPAWQPKPR